MYTITIYVYESSNHKTYQDTFIKRFAGNQSQAEKFAKNIHRQMKNQFPKMKFTYNIQRDN
jgi:hypothetical protein